MKKIITLFALMAAFAACTSPATTSTSNPADSVYTYDTLKADSITVEGMHVEEISRDSDTLK